MRVGASTLAVGLLLSVALPGRTSLAADPGEQLMLARANFWRAQQRPDLAREILGKLLAANPSQPDALYQRGTLAMEQGDRGGAQAYFDRLRDLAPADGRAAQLLALLPQAAAASPAATPTPTAASAAPAGSSPPALPTATASDGPVANAVISAPRIRVAAAEPATPLVKGSADSDDLIGANPAGAIPAAAPPRALVSTVPSKPARVQLASLQPATVADGDTGPARAPLPSPPPVTVSDGDTMIPTRTPAELGSTPGVVQVAQVELQPPPPVGGYQPLGTLRPYSPSDTLETYIERDLERLEMQANPTLVAGLGYRTHTGTEGVGRLDEFGATDQLSFSPWYTGTATLAVLPVYLEAGTPANINLTNFGANRLLASFGIGNARAIDQNATGVGLLGTYAYDDFTGQIGTTPLGFPVTNIIGDLAYAPKFLGGNLSVRIEGFRQPVTDTVLSYAGTRASLRTANAISGGAFGGYSPIWGGVIKTGPRVTAFYDDQYYGAYGGVGYSWLTGTNVADNSEIDALLGAYFRPLKTDYWTLRVGVSLFYAGYDKNLSAYTYGNGGYFSPQDFEGLGFPLEISGSYDRWSYLASTTLGAQHFNEKSSPVFPINPNAQQILQTVSPSTAFSTGIHGGIGFGFNIKGQLEYAVDKTFALGIAGSANNTNNYDEGIVQVYLRKTFDWFAPVAFKNDPQSIAARDQPMSHL